MILPLKSRSVRTKVLTVVLITTLAALLTMSGAMVMYDARTYERAWVNDLAAQADILGRTSAAALAFDDPNAAAENLSALQARPAISAAAIYNAQGRLFASYAQSPGSAEPLPSLPEPDGYRIAGNQIELWRRIVDDNQIVGTVYLNAPYYLMQRTVNYLQILAAVVVGSLLVAVALSIWLQRSVSKPIVSVADIARRIMEQRDFTLRASKTTEDEFGDLVDAFNAMLDEVERRAETLEHANTVLEHEVRERSNAERALRLSERRSATLVSAITSLVWVADEKGRFVEELPSWSRYTGQTADVYHGWGWRKAFREEDRTALELAWVNAMAEATPFELECALWHQPSQQYRFVRIQAVPVIEPDGPVYEWIGTVTDIHDQRHAESELRTLNSELEQRVEARTAELETANKELEGFSYSVSHDLRAPVRAVAGFARLLREDHGDQLDAEAQRKLDVVLSEAHRMGVLIDELLAFSRLGRKALQLSELDMNRLARSIYEQLRSQHHESDPTVQFGALPTARGDRVLMEQVWANLLSNALKFSAKQATPVIEVGAVTDRVEHIYFVRDNGAGFDPRYQSKLFGVFQRLHDAKDFQGTGVGLALVQRIVNRHGGRVWAEGKPGAGATFYFTLPKEETHGTA